MNFAFLSGHQYQRALDVSQQIITSTFNSSLNFLHQAKLHETHTKILRSYHDSYDKNQFNPSYFFIQFLSKQKWPSIISNKKFILRLEQPNPDLNSVFNFFQSFFSFEIKKHLDTKAITDQASKKMTSPTIQIFRVNPVSNSTDFINLQQQLHLESNQVKSFYYDKVVNEKSNSSPKSHLKLWLERREFLVKSRMPSESILEPVIWEDKKMKTPEERALLDIQNKNSKLKKETYILVEKSVSESSNKQVCVDVKNFGALIQGVVNAVVNGGLDALENSIGSCLETSGERKITNVKIVDELAKQVELLDLAMLVYEKNCPNEMVLFYEELERNYESYRLKIINKYGSKTTPEVQKLIDTMSVHTGTSRSSSIEVKNNAESEKMFYENCHYNSFSPESLQSNQINYNNNRSILSEGASKIVNSVLKRTDTVKLKDSKWRKKLKKLGDNLKKPSDKLEHVSQAHSSVSLNVVEQNNHQNGNRLSLNSVQFQKMNQINKQYFTKSNNSNNRAGSSVTNSNFGSTGNVFRQPSQEQQPQTSSIKPGAFYRPSSTKDISTKPMLPPKTIKQKK